MNYHLTGVLLIVAAVILEVSGFSAVASAFGIVFLGAGVALEVWFWIRLVRVRAVRNLLRRGGRTPQPGHPPDQAVEARSVLFLECLLERLDQHVRMLRLERQRRANLEHIALAAG
jgi:hypothetical protein